MKCDDFLEMVMTEYKGAKEKHPVFADQFTDFATVAFAKHDEETVISAVVRKENLILIVYSLVILGPGSESSSEHS